MLTNRSRGKELLITLLFVAILSTSTVARAEDNFEAMASMVNLMDSFFGLMNSVYDMNADDEKAVLWLEHCTDIDVPGLSSLSNVPAINRFHTPARFLYNPGDFCIYQQTGEMSC